MDSSLVQALLHPPVYLTMNVTLFICGILVLMMQPGFMLFEAGSVSRKNAINNIFKNVIDICLCGMFFWWIGYNILSGQSVVNEFFVNIGLTRDLLNLVQIDPDAAEATTNILPTEPVRAFFQLVFACTAVTITSGCVTGRVRPFHYIFFSVFFSTLVYPIAAFMVWHPDGLFFGVFRDFAGAAVVHALGGFAGLMGALMLRPRLGYYRHGADVYGDDVVDGLADSHQPHNIPLAALGVFLLWIGWFGYNSGTLFGHGVPEFTTLEADNILSGLEAIFETFGQIMANTILAPCASVCLVTFLMLARQEELDMLLILNAAIAGLVSITAAADVASPLSAVLIGSAAGVGLMVSVAAMAALRIDDPVGAFPAHGIAGIIGIIAAAFYPLDGKSVFEMLLSQTAVAAALILFSCLSAYLIFSTSRFILLFLHRVGVVHSLVPGFGKNLLRVSPDVELEGLDLHLHGRDAYNVYDNG
ncbi:MAG: ammonium transporter [Alphaproteobacteria bacterium]